MNVEAVMAESALWKEVLMAKYGIRVINYFDLGRLMPPFYVSLSWKDIGRVKVGLDLS